MVINNKINRMFTAKIFYITIIFIIVIYQYIIVYIYILYITKCKMIFKLKVVFTHNCISYAIIHHLINLKKMKFNVFIAVTY